MPWQWPISKEKVASTSDYTEAELHVLNLHRHGLRVANSLNIAWRTLYSLLRVITIAAPALVFYFAGAINAKNWQAEVDSINLLAVILTVAGGLDAAINPQRTSDKISKCRNRISELLGKYQLDLARKETGKEGARTEEWYLARCNDVWREYNNSGRDTSKDAK